MKIFLLNAGEPECVSTESALRNSGINIHIKNIESASELTQNLAVDRPLMLLFRTSGKNLVSFEDALQVARENQLLLAVQLAPENLEFVKKAMNASSLTLLNVNADQQLINLVQRQLERTQREHDFGRQAETHEELEQINRQLLDGSAEAIAYLHEGLHIDANRAYRDMMGFTDISKVQATSLLDLVRGTETDIKSVVRDTAGDQFPESPVAVIVSPLNGDQFPADLVFSPARVSGEDCIQIRVRRGVQDEQSPAGAELPGAPKAQLVGRQAFLGELQSLVSGCSPDNGRASLLFLEPDRVGELADSVGYTAFIQWTEEVAKTVLAFVTEKDSATLIGSCAFAVLCREDAGQRAASVFDRIRQALSETRLDEKSVGTVKISAGIAIIAGHSLGADEVIDQARMALREAQKQGGTLKRYEPKRIETGHSNDDQLWGKRIRHALNNESFYSVQSAIVNLEGESEGLFENRVFLKEEPEDIPAREFLAHAERLELGSAIDRLVIPSLLKSISGAGDRHIVSLSANSLLDFSFPSWFQHQIQELEVQGSQLIVQIPAAVAASNLRACRKLSHELKNHGVQFALSDFDDQDSRLGLLNEIAVDLVTLDTGICESLKESREQQAAVRRIVEAVEASGAMVVASDIQDAADMAALWQCGVRLVCGDYLRELTQITG